ncbi:hypothetical protein L0F63_004896 [Massospora cicadina]|nr:hypothetical protein L0F63_004896 [Massospora cicadina]
MGTSQSTGHPELWSEELENLEGFHVLKLKPNSPAETSGLRAYFDIIVAVDGNNTFRTIQEFAQHLSARVNRVVSLTVLSLKTRSLRELKLTPKVGWSSNPNDGLLGCSVRYSSVERAQTSAWHILDIHPGSPAERAGLQAFSDYVIGCEHHGLEREDDFFDLIIQHENKILSLLVYNAVWDNCRDVVIIPKSDWGGEGLLGCGVAYGLLHRIPIEADFVQGSAQEAAPREPTFDERSGRLANLVLNPPPSVIPTEATPPTDESKLSQTDSDLASLPSTLPVDPQTALKSLEPEVSLTDSLAKAIQTPENSAQPEATLKHESISNAEPIEMPHISPNSKDDATNPTLAGHPSPEATVQSPSIQDADRLA